MSAELSLSQQMDESVVPLGTKNGIELAILRRSKKTLGEVIGKSDSPDLIEGVRIEPLQIHPDDRGFFVELARLGEGLATKMVPEGDRRIQVSFTLTYPGIIKAIHYHTEQTDLWVPISGMVQVYLYDLRRNSKTYGLINTIFVGSYRPSEILISPGVGHGYKALGVEPILRLGNPAQMNTCVS
jgi:dTDP-4-dehydrorhamnose 3,5-epimerase